MTIKLSTRQFCVAALSVLLALMLLPHAAALAAGCCFRQITIKSLETGQEVSLSGPVLTAPYDLSTFWSFTDFSQRVSKPVRSGPAYEVARDGWDHLIYYPGVGDQAGVVYYEGLFNGSSEYDGKWFAVPPAQDAALRQTLVQQGFPSGSASGALVSGALALGLAVAGLLLIGFLLYGLRRSALAVS